jgi:glucosamine--fructose-6-phosphate aminotransferase (isomerizing)
VERIQILACGTSRHAVQLGAYLLEQLAGIPTSVFYASEFRYAPPPLGPNTLTIGVTQSGETADRPAALAMEQERRRAVADPAYAPRLLGITNGPESSPGPAGGSDPRHRHRHRGGRGCNENVPGAAAGVLRISTGLC